LFPEQDIIADELIERENRNPDRTNRVEIYNGDDDMARRDSLWRRLTDWLTAQRIAAILFVIGLLIVAGGATYHHCACQSWPNFVTGWEQEFEAFYANLATTLVGIATAVFTVDRANERRAEQQLKQQLIREMGASNRYGCDTPSSTGAASAQMAFCWIVVQSAPA
jgi:hypothetical protein